MELPSEFPLFDVAYPVLLLEHILPEIDIHTQNIFTRLVSYYFSEPQELCCVLENLASSAFTKNDLVKYLTSKIEAKMDKEIYSCDNTILLL